MIGGLTYVYIADQDPSTQKPSGDAVVSFVNYDEAMSYAKWLDTEMIGTGEGQIWVWNYNGGSGLWLNNVFVSKPNSNYPTP